MGEAKPGNVNALCLDTKRMMMRSKVGGSAGTVQLVAD